MESQQCILGSEAIAKLTLKVVQRLVTIWVNQKGATTSGFPKPSQPNSEINWSKRPCFHPVPQCGCTHGSPSVVTGDTAHTQPCTFLSGKLGTSFTYWFWGSTGSWCHDGRLGCALRWRQRKPLPCVRRRGTVNPCFEPLRLMLIGFKRKRGLLGHLCWGRWRRREARRCEQQKWPKISSGEKQTEISALQKSCIFSSHFPKLKVGISPPCLWKEISALPLKLF